MSTSLPLVASPVSSVASRSLWSSARSWVGMPAGLSGSVALALTDWPAPTANAYQASSPGRSSLVYCPAGCGCAASGAAAAEIGSPRVT